MSEEKQPKITDYFKSIASLDPSIDFKQKCKIFHTFTSTEKYNFLKNHFEIIFLLSFSRYTSFNIQNIAAICFKHFPENQFIFPNYGNLVGNKFTIGQLKPYPFQKTGTGFHFYYDHAIGIRQSGLSVADGMYNFYFKCLSEKINEILIGIIATNKSLEQIVTGARENNLKNNCHIFEDGSLASCYYLGLSGGGRISTSTVYYLEYGYPHEILRRHNNPCLRKHWPCSLNKNDVVHFKMLYGGIVTLEINGYWMHTFKIENDARNSLFFPTISIPVDKQGESVQFEMTTDKTVPDLDGLLI